MASYCFLLPSVFLCFPPQLELLYDQVKLRHAAKAISFADFGRACPDDEPQMFNLRARLIACLDTENATTSDRGAYDDTP